MGFLDAFKAVYVPSGQALGRTASLAVIGADAPDSNISSRISVAGRRKMASVARIALLEVVFGEVRPIIHFQVGHVFISKRFYKIHRVGRLAGGVHGAGVRALGRSSRETDTGVSRIRAARFSGF